MHSSSLCLLVFLAFASGLPQFQNFKPFPNFKPARVFNSITPTTPKYDYNNYFSRVQTNDAGRYQGGSDDGQYHPDESGAYVADGSGSYLHDDSPYQHHVGSDGDDGRYRDDSGAYVHQDSPYVHQLGPFGGSGPDGGRYKDNFDNSRYNPDNSGAYRGDNSGDYQGDNSGSHKGTKDSGVFGTGLGGRKPAPISNFGTNQVKPKYSGVQLCHDPLCRVLRLDETVEQDGYHYAYETENKIFGEEEGHLKNKGTDQEAMNAKGYYEYTGPDGTVFRVDYTADENGFHPVGAHIPTVPPAIARSLEYLRSVGQL